MINNLLYIGSTALMNAQVGISVTSGNIANVDTEGYSRKTVSYATRQPTVYAGWQVGTGADVSAIKRNFDRYVEKQYLAANGTTSFWYTQAQVLASVETLFGQSGDYGLSTVLDTFFSSATALQQDAAGEALREEFLEYAATLADTLRNLDDDLAQQLRTLDDSISDAVDETNALLQEIADLNAQCAAAPDNSALQDERDLKIRALSELVDVNAIQQDNGMITLKTAEGHSLVDGTECYKFAYEPPQAFQTLDADSAFDGRIYFDGENARELTIDMLTSGPADGSASAATFRVSMDGGETWLTDENGEPLVFTAGDSANRVTVEGVDIWFGTASDPTATATTAIDAEDEFSIVAKDAVYWYRTTSSKVNVTPLSSSPDESEGRLTGGSLGGLLAVRDHCVAAAREEMDALANELIWQMNYQHSQGAGLVHRTYADSANAVNDTAIPLADTDLSYADRITAGGLSFALYDADTGESLGVEAVDFSSIVPPGISTFDPAQHSLEDVAAAINATYGGRVTATISDGGLTLEAADGVEFEFAGDSTGLLAAMGVNTLFTGDGLDDIAVDARVSSNPNLLCCAVVDGTGMVDSADNTNITALAALADADMTLSTSLSSVSQTFSEHLHAVVSGVGLDTDVAARNHTISSTLSENLATSQEEVAGVNMDEELANLTRYQQAYEAASMLIQTANELFDVIMSLKS
ncbi:MAG: flagellar hook-associated protein FlgK [Desulfovibrionaceae bacterium]|jgi:flagellar hook-associated protein 1 FlgK|nr:flagellar hook-associated protein FlgK [Desulfovibrionaceae bacterium]